MKICILTPRFPFPENGGDVLRINNIARYLKSRGHKLILVSFYEQQPDVTAANALYDKVYVIRRNRFWSAIYSLIFMLLRKPIQCGYYFSMAYKRLLKRVVKEEEPELFIAHLLRMAPYLESLSLEQQSIIEMTDALSKTYTMSSTAKGNFLKRFIYGIEKPLIERYERAVISTFPKVVLVSQTDIDYLNKGNVKGHNSLALHTNGVECPLLMGVVGVDANKICFIGNMRTLQNQDAVVHFVNDIFPLIKLEMPNAEFHIVGAEPSAIVKGLADNKNIFVTGFVDDLPSYVSDCCVAVAPVQVAAGIQNKVLLSMALKLPVVLSSLISRAIPELEHERNCYILDKPKDVAEACVRLMRDVGLRTMIAENGYEMVCERYSWQMKLSGYEYVDVGPTSVE